MTTYNDCAYCGATILDEESHRPPAVDDDLAWALVTAEHNPGCEWARTRAHRLDGDE